MAPSAIWTEPKDWSNGELVTDANMNAQVRDNLYYLWQRGVHIGGSWPSGVSLAQNTHYDDICYYNGSVGAWISAHECSLSLGIYASGAPPWSGAAPLYLLWAPSDTDASPGIYVTRVRITTIVNTLSNASNYWTLSLREFNGTIINSAITTGDAAAGTVGYHAYLADFGGSHGVAITTPTFYLRADSKTGTPGVLYAACTVYYRRMFL